MNLGEAEYELMFRQSPLPMWIHDIGTLRFIDANQAAERELGYSLDEWLRMSVFDIRPPSERPRLQAVMESLRGRPTVATFDWFGVWVYLRKDGRRIDMEIRTTNMEVGGRAARLIVAVNVTEARASDEALRESEARYRALARRLQTIREEERVALSRTIHDELGQSLTALKIDLSVISKRLDPGLQERVEAAAAAVDGMIQQVRNIATELRPGVLDHLGLTAAMEWQAKEFTRRSGIACRFHPSSEEPGLTQEEAVSLFRILQESLTNVARHAHATEVNVSLGINADAVKLTIEDNGIGLSEQRRKDPASLGLIGMEERAHFINARLSIESPKKITETGAIDSSIRRGTRVVVDLPFSKAPPKLIEAVSK
jgi:PAS domain S-box-containing protein